jgi:hypothetical protein
MGWEPSLRIWLKNPKEPGRTCMDLASYVETSSLFGKFLRIVVMGDPYSDNAIKSLDSVDVGISNDEIEKIIAPPNAQNIAVECWWETYYYHAYKTEKIYGKWHTKIVEEPWRIVITILGCEYEWSGKPNNIHMIWEIGRDVYVSPKHSGEIAQLNILSLICQISFLIEFGVSKVHAPNQDNELHPETFYLVYHSDPDGFRQDLTIWTQHISPQPSLTKEDLIEVIRSCEKIEYVEVTGGLLIFHQDFVDGSLESFYNGIVKILEQF